MTYTLTYDYENHLTAVSGGSINASFFYDADGNRVKGTVNGTTTVYIAGLYEYQGGATTLYYEGNAFRRTGYVANNGVFYLLRDQLQSSSVMINQNGTVNSRNYFYPFGGNRGGAAFSSLTTKRFTGQYQEAGLPGGEGLSYYGARWYDAQLGRFTSPDSIVPSPGNPQTLNRYSYVNNNPIRFTDPSGHFPFPWNNFDRMLNDPGPAAGSGGGGLGGYAVAQAAVAAATVTQTALRYGVDPLQATQIASNLVKYQSEIQDFYEAIESWRGGRRYVGEGRSGISFDLQDAITNTIRNSGDPHMVVAFRGRAPGSSIWEDAFDAKPEGAKTILEGACGLRYCRVGDKYGYFVSDLDPAFAFYKGQPMWDGDFMDVVGEPININYGYRVVQHGSHIVGFFHQVPGASEEKLWDEVYIFNANGFVGEGPMWMEYHRFGGRYLAAPERGRRPK